MQKSFLIIFGVATLFIANACNKSEPAENPYTRLEGTWRLVATATDDNLNGQLDDAEIQAVTGPAELLKFNYDSSGNEHKVVNNVTEDYTFTWQFKNTFHQLVRVITGDTIISQIDQLTDADLYLRNMDTVFYDSSMIATWKIYKKK